ncbi:hypothetical protein G3I77_37675 [Streptomyces sp. D2-8]|nr:hypothetical protein [Streptomyces sp. D2-8]
MANSTCEGYIAVASPATGTGLPAGFATGDVVDHTCHQAITGAVAAPGHRFS